MDITKFTYADNSIYFIWLLAKSWLFKQLTRNSTNLFLRGQDIISILPQISGNHEIITTKLIEFFAQNGYDDFLIDIGANIGLISCQSGQKFKKVHMYEPNPICCCILEANSLLSLSHEKFEIHNFGLGDENSFVKLTIPRNNWGGAYVQSSKNCYSSEILANKDGCRDFDSENYFAIDVSIKNAKDHLSKIFSELLTSDLSCGVIKIDVEGYELVILQGIASALPKETKVQIVFESLDSEFKVNKVLEMFANRRATAYILSENFPWNRHRVKLPNFIKVLYVMFKVKVKTVLKPLTVGSYCKGTLVIEVD